MLAGVRVLELAHERVTLAGRILADLGADVIRCEPPGGAPDRARGPFLGGIADRERSLAHLALNAGKRGITLDWRREAGQAPLADLIADCDVLLEGELPGSVDLSACHHEGLVHCAVTPFGQDGPWARYEAGDLVLVALGGNLALTGDPSRPPVRCSMPTSLYHGAPEAVLGVLMALYAREQIGHGDFVDCSLHECQLATTMTAPTRCALGEPERPRAGDRIGRTREIWRARDGWISFGLRGGPARSANLEATVTWMREHEMAPDWLQRIDWSRYDPAALSDEELAALEDAFAAFFASHSMRGLYEGALARRILLAPCNDAREIAEHPQLRARALFVPVDLPELDATLELPGFFARIGRRPGENSEVRVRGRAPRLGEHNDAVYTALGRTSDELARLRAEGVVS